MLGTFLPWLRSGSVLRNSYASDHALRRLLHVHGALDALLSAWPFVSLACAVAVALILLGSPRSGALVALVAALCAGGVAIWTLTTGANGLIRAATTGPAVTLGGAAFTLVCLLAQFVPLDRRAPR